LIEGNRDIRWIDAGITCTGSLHGSVTAIYADPRPLPALPRPKTLSEKLAEIRSQAGMTTAMVVDRIVKLPEIAALLDSK
jgi:hypothetical protein